MLLVQIIAIIFYYLPKMSLFCYMIPYTTLMTLFGIWHQFLGCYDTFYTIQYLGNVIKVYTKGRYYALDRYNTITTQKESVLDVTNNLTHIALKLVKKLVSPGVWCVKYAYLISIRKLGLDVCTWRSREGGNDPGSLWTKGIGIFS